MAEGTLAGRVSVAATPPAAAPTALMKRLVIDGKAPEASPGRADDFSWPPKANPAAAAADAGTTTAINR